MAFNGRLREYQLKQRSHLLDEQVQPLVAAIQRDFAPAPLCPKTRALLRQQIDHRAKYERRWWRWISLALSATGALVVWWVWTRSDVPHTRVPRSSVASLVAETDMAETDIWTDAVLLTEGVDEEDSDEFARDELPREYAVLITLINE